MVSLHVPRESQTPLNTPLNIVFSTIFTHSVVEEKNQIKLRIREMKLKERSIRKLKSMINKNRSNGKIYRKLLHVLNYVKELKNAFPIINDVASNVVIVNIVDENRIVILPQILRVSRNNEENEDVVVKSLPPILINGTIKKHQYVIPMKFCTKFATLFEILGINIYDIYKCEDGM